MGSEKIPLIPMERMGVWNWEKDLKINTHSMTDCRTPLSVISLSRCEKFCSNSGQSCVTCIKCGVLSRKSVSEQCLANRKGVKTWSSFWRGFRAKSQSSKTSCCLFQTSKVQLSKDLRPPSTHLKIPSTDLG